jgi:hypothetical protein
LLEFFHVSAFGSAHDSKVRTKRDLVFLLVENLPVRDISHQKLDKDEEFLSLDTEAKSSNFGTFSLGLDQVSLRFRVLHLHGLNASNVVQIASVLVVGARRRESSFCDEVVSLLVEVLGQVRSDNDVHQSGLTDLIVMQASFLVSMEHLGSVVKASMKSLLLIGNRHEVVSLSYNVVHKTRVGVSNSAVNEITEVSSVFVVIQERLRG